MTELPANNHIIPWKHYIITTLQALLAFYIATFCVAVYFIHRDAASLLTSIILGILYVSVIILCAIRTIKKLSIAAVMLIIPIAPLLALIIVISLIPVLQWL